MSDFFIFNETVGKRYEEKGDLEGFEVHARDGDVGRVMDVCERPGESFVVVDTGHWLFSKKVMLPAGIIERVDYEAERVYVDRSRDEIKAAPEFDERIYLERDYREDLARHYTGA